MSQEQKKLEVALERLETSTRKILDTRGYTHDARKLKTLHEMIREQLIHANTRPSTRTIR